MKLGTCAYSYRDLLTSGEMTMIEFLDLAAELNFDGVELTGYYFAEETKEYLVGIKREAFVRGLDICATATGGNFADADETKRSAQIAKIKEWIDISAILGSTALRVFAGGCPEGVEPAFARKWVTDGLAECAPKAESEGVILALENHGGLTADAEGTLALIEPFAANPWVQLNLDFGNFTGDNYGQYAACAPHAATTHTKLTVRQGDGREPVDYRRVVRLMREAGYSGYLNIEYEEKEPPIPYVERFASYLRGCIADA
ncbi:MAG: sugar phosphate isomerase/epimerase family protein [Candidatus Latescibacterota bacterium]|nr:sugar phosphate isomerase/epimerase family protein [Candidatus Latescibacterota bacterium]